MLIDISKFDQCRLLVVGDLMLDEYLWGEVDRISPEAPVQVVAIQKEDFALGGAGNVVNNVVALGGKVSAVGVIGTGRNGQLLLNMFNDLGVNTKGIIQEPGRITTQKTRIIAANQHVLRIDRETQQDISITSLEKITRFIEDKMPDIDVILISDYGKGLITKSMLSRVTASAKNHNKMIIVDPKGLDFSKYSGVSLLTPNKKEAALASGVDIFDESSLEKAAHKILQHIDIDMLLITCGKDGMVLFERDKTPFRIEAEARQIFDVSGAGDTVLAVLGVAVASGISIQNSVAMANTAAGIVVGKVGTATVSKPELLSAMKTENYGLPAKYKDLSELPALIKDLKNKEKSLFLVVFQTF